MSDIKVEPKVTLAKDQLHHLNKTLSYLTPQEILQWAIITFPNLYQTTALGLTGLVTLDMVSKLPKNDLNSNTHAIDLIFIDTLHHFPQTLTLLENIKQKYPDAHINIVQPDGVHTEQEFAASHGDFLWETNEDLYDFLVKVEPAQRVYRDLKVSAVLTGRRRSQGGARGSLPVIEIEEVSGIIKINPLADWDFKKVHDYIKENQVPYNELLDLGYRSIGDYHSTHPIAEGEDERSGRWKGKAKTECGIHETSKFAQYLKEQAAKKEKEATNV